MRCIGAYKLIFSRVFHLPYLNKYTQRSVVTQGAAFVLSPSLTFFKLNLSSKHYPSYIRALDLMKTTSSDSSEVPRRKKSSKVSEGRVGANCRVGAARQSGTLHRLSHESKLT